MAPTRPSTKKKHKSKQHLVRKPTTSDPTAIRNLLTSATALLEQGDAVSARKLARDALSSIEDARSPSSSLPLGAALTLLGSIAVDTGDIEIARAYFLKAVESDPEGSLPDDVGGGAEKFLWLAQLSEEGGRDSLSWFERGAGALRKGIGQAEADKKTDVAEEKKRKLAETLCAVAELYMTDLSWEEDAENRCETLVAEAGLVAPDHPETWQTVANVRISQERQKEARAALERSMEIWRDSAPEDPRVPAFATRVGLARLLMEVEEEDKAVDVVERLVGEDDSSVEAWYLGGYALYTLGAKAKEGKSKEEDKDDWKGTWRSARGWLAQCLLLFQAQDYEDERLGEHARELLETIREEIGDDDGDDDEDGWEDDAEEEDEEDEEMK